MRIDDDRQTNLPNKRRNAQQIDLAFRRPSPKILSMQNLTQEQARAFFLGGCEEPIGRVALHDRATIHEDDVIGGVAREAHLVRHLLVPWRN
jgi:hypothetical protein